MTPEERFLNAVGSMEQALADALTSVNGSVAAGAATSVDLERLLKLIIKKEIVLEFLLEEFPFQPRA